MNILGTEYQLQVDDEYLKEENADGVCMGYDKIIKVRNVESMLGRKDSVAVKQKRYNEVLRHEIIHAFFSESGMEDWSRDEVLVNYLAMQFPKLVGLFKEQECLQ